MANIRWLLMKDTQEQGRLLRSAEELKAYFEEKMKTSPLSAEKVASVREALDGLLATSRQMEDSKDALNRLQQRVGTIQEEVPSNVIQLRRKPVLTRPPAFSKVDDKRWILRLDCLIESQHVSEIHKMAMELHSHSRRYAFIEYRDIDPKTRLVLPELLSMGAISVFVASVLDLSLREQNVLRSLMEVESVQRPLLMVGSHLPFSELRGEAGVDLGFLNHLSRAYIKLTKPFSHYKDQGLIHYFLDSLSESPT